MMVMASLSYMLAKMTTLYYEPHVDIFFKKNINTGAIDIYWLFLWELPNLIVILSVLGWYRNVTLYYQ